MAWIRDGGSVCVSVLADATYAECAREAVLSVLESSSFDVHLSVVGVVPDGLPRTPRLRITDLGLPPAVDRASTPGEPAWPPLRKLWALQRCLAWTQARTLMSLDADAVLVARLEESDLISALAGRSLGMIVEDGMVWPGADELRDRMVRRGLQFVAPGTELPPGDRFRFYNSGVVLWTRAELERVCAWAIDRVMNAGRPHSVGAQKIDDQPYLQFWANVVAPDRTTALPWHWNHSEVWHADFPRPGARILHFSNLSRGPAGDTAARMRAARQIGPPTVSESEIQLPITVLGELPDPGEPVEAERVLVLSRFAWLRRADDGLVAETSLGPCAVRIDDPRAQAFILGFATAQRVGAAADAAALPLADAQRIGSVLLAAQVLIDTESGPVEEQPPLAVWEFHDLLFHTRSRPGRHRNLSGGSYRFVDRFPPAPAIPPARWPETTFLPRVDGDRLEREDPPLAAVQAARTSVREYGDRAISAAELGEFLFRVGRVEDYWQIPLPSRADGSMSFVAKPYPSGGALYELELYAAIRSCEGVDAGLHHYAADRHVLERVAGPSAAVTGLISDAAGAMGGVPEAMQAVIVLTARVQRTAWKYESLAYALVLKHVGVVLQTMYLVATAMGLAPCALGTGNSDLFAQASGIDFYQEAAVGEFALGTRRSPGPLGRPA